MNISLGDCHMMLALIPNQAIDPSFSRFAAVGDDALDPMRNPIVDQTVKTQKQGTILLKI